MTMTDDTILFVKETKTCSYVLAIHTPRLCAEPGFRSRLDSNGEAQIHCREIIPNALPESETTSTDSSATSAGDANVDQAGVPLPVTDYPLKMARPRAVDPPVAKQPGQDLQKDKLYEDLLRKTLEVLFGGENAKLVAGKSPTLQNVLLHEDGRIEFSDDSESAEQPSEAMDKLAEVFRAAGYEITPGPEVEQDANNEEGDEEGNYHTMPGHNEL